MKRCGDDMDVGDVGGFGAKWRSGGGISSWPKKKKIGNFVWQGFLLVH